MNETSIDRWTFIELIIEPKLKKKNRMHIYETLPRADNKTFDIVH